MVGILTLPLVGTIINDKTNKDNGYFYFLIFLLFFNSISCVFAVWAFLYDLRNKQKLHNPGATGEDTDETDNTYIHDQREITHDHLA